jgi:RNA polymerase subunit RPABC4/transcription elongation factor Spt4
MDVKVRQAGEISWVGLILSVKPEANKIALNLGRKK